jgi:membrane-associated protein
MLRELRTNERLPVERRRVLDSLVDLISSSNWTYLVIVAIAYLDAIIPIVPSETAVIAAGVLAGTGDLKLSLVIIAGAIGAYTGDTTAYLLGRQFGPQISGLVFRGEKGQQRHDWAERGLDRYGGPLIFGARFVPGGRTAVTVSSGVLRMRWARFAIYAGIAAIAWASYAALIGYLGGKAFEDNPIWGLLLGFGIAAAVFVIVEVVRRARVKTA